MTILDQIAATYGRFTPKTPDEFFALRLAIKLDDEKAASHYASLLTQRGRDALLVAYGRAKKRPGTGGDLARRFHDELTGTNGQHLGSSGKLLALKIERRTVSAAGFCGTRLEFTDSRELSSVASKAIASSSGFLDWVCQVFDSDSVALEPEITGEIRRAALHKAIVAIIRERGFSIRETPKAELIASFAVPAPRTRRELREIVCSIWPILDPDRFGILDAAALGLYVQTERLFS